VPFHHLACTSTNQDPTEKVHANLLVPTRHLAFPMKDSQPAFHVGLQRSMC
jgi:hypothetical protein